MTIAEFAAVTRRVIDAEGLDGFLPTACYPERGEIATLRGLPPEVEAEPAVLRWAGKRASPGELHLVAFRSGAGRFTVVRVRGPERESAAFEVPAPDC